MNSIEPGKQTGNPSVPPSAAVVNAARPETFRLPKSGGKSLHGWFYCAEIGEEITRSFMRYAVSLGADRAMWTRSQFVRMPDGTRENGTRQTLWFYKPAIVGGAR